jgi:hypothetical protein
MSNTTVKENSFGGKEEFGFVHRQLSMADEPLKVADFGGYAQGKSAARSMSGIREFPAATDFITYNFTEITIHTAANQDP